jgi:response regulator NasT
MSAPATSRRLILLVDDDTLLLDYLATVLQQAGYDTVGAASAAEALQRIAERDAAHQEHGFALALLDITMPGMSGLDLARRLKDHTEVPFMFLSSVDDAETARQAASHGALGFVSSRSKQAACCRPSRPRWRAPTRSASCAAPRPT